MSSSGDKGFPSKKLETALQDFVSLGKKPVPKKKKPRIIHFQRDKSGNRSYPYKGKRNRKIPKSPSNKGSSAVKELVDIDSEYRIDTESTSKEIFVDYSEDFQTVALQSIKVLGNNLKENIGRKKRSWKTRMENYEHVWDQERSNVLAYVIEKHKQTGVCQSCFQCDAIISCLECREQKLCQHCDVEHHYRYPLHNRTSFAQGFPVPLSPSECLNDKKAVISCVRFVPLNTGKCECGSATFTQELVDDVTVLITLTGRFELMRFCNMCRNCGVKHNPFSLKNILQSGFWPCSPKNFNCLIKLDVFVLWDQFRKQMPGSSEKSFLESLNALTVSNGRVGKIVQPTFSHAFKEWSFCNFELSSLQRKDWMKCPCCTINQHSCHVDGNCKLYRYRSSGSRRRSSYYKDLFIVEDSKIENMMSSVYKSKQLTAVKSDIDKTCGGDWSAAKNIARKKGAVDTTGLEVAVCRHQFGQKALNMKQGELYAYALYLIKEHMIPNNVEFVFADVMCKLWKFLRRVDPHICSNIKGALSVMHAKGHSLECQVLWDGEWVDGTGRSTGEECEQVFSYLSRCSNNTKYQIPENREETLTEMMLFWNRRKTIQLAEALSKKYRRVETDLMNFNSEMQNCLMKIGIEASAVNLDQIVQDVKNSATCRVRSLPGVTRAQTVILLYHHLKPYLPPNLCLELKEALDQLVLPNLSLVNIPILNRKKAEKETLLCDSLECLDASGVNCVFSNLISVIIIPAFQTAIESCCFERVHWNTRIQKVADTSKQRFLFRKKLSLVKTRMTLLTAELNRIQSSSFTCEDFKNGIFPWNASSCSVLNSSLTDADKRVLAETHQKISRSEEELLLLKRDMESYLKYYSTLSEEIQLEISTLNTNNGHESLLRQGLAFCEIQVGKGLKFFCELLSPELLENHCPNLPFEIDETDDTEHSQEVLQNSDFDVEIDLNLIQDLGRELISDNFLEMCHFQCNDNVTDMFLPSAYSQSTINGRNGSYACSTISLLIGIFASRYCIFKDGFVVENIVPVFLGCMDIGNDIHGTNKMLTVHEAISLLPNNLNGLIISNERNSFLNNIQVTLQNYELATSHCFIVVVAADKTICCVNHNDRFYMFDSHAHGTFGASILSCRGNDLFPVVSRLENVKDDDIIYSCIVTIADHH